MKARKESGIISQHSGTVNCISFSPNGSHLLSGSEDGSIAIFRTGSWQLEKLFTKAHKGEAVTSLSVHPSGKLALSVGTDATLRTWNLVKGRQAYATNLGKNRTGKGRAVSCLLWSPDGNLYVVPVGIEVNIYDVSTAGIVHTIQLQQKVTCICFCQDTILAVGDEGGGLSFHSISDKKQLIAVEAHEHRIKCITFISTKEDNFIVSASSGGHIRLWNYKNGKVKSICHTNTDCRITCLVILEGQNSNQKCMKEDVLQIHSIYNGTGNDKEAIKPKRLRKDSEDSESVNRIHDNKAKKKNLKLSEASQSLDVICTRGQKWLVEEL
ncbi:p21-activated protein kinase-interacting protein 1-like isoform X2 [Zootermopsis nevadensis]|nr:p21-activated protein kinase-interacting protein 1-like isoform X2 [Zootermopsis nevadensis]